ncbi:MAG: hypothetical protein AAB407_01680 [Patescibacteria group bacterium]
MKLSPSIFKAYDVRGKYPGEINEDVALLLGKALGLRWMGGEIIVGYDARVSSPELAEALTKGIRAAAPESTVTSVGLITTPMLTYLIHSRGAKAGVVVTASHNPKEYNGFKAVEGHGTAWITGTDMQKLIAQLL